MSKLITTAILASTSLSALAIPGGGGGIGTPLPEPETAAMFAVAAVVGLAARYLKK